MKIKLIGIETGCCWSNTLYFKESIAFFNNDRNYGIELEGGWN